VADRSFLSAGSVLVALAVGGCNPVVHLTPGRLPSLPESEDVTVIDARGMPGGELESLLAEYRIIARFHKRVFGEEGLENKVQQAVEQAKATVMQVGGNVLLYTQNSELVATLMRDAHFAGPPDAIVMYAMREK
jgi:hypothetical protein